MSDSPPPLTSSGIRLPAVALPEALRPYVLEVYEEAIPAPPSGPLNLPISAGVTPVLNATLQGRAWIGLASGEGFWMPPLLLSGPQPDAYAATCHGEVRGFYATFHAVGPLALLGVKRYWRGGPDGPPAMADLVRPGFATRTREYEGDLRVAPDFESRADLTVAYLLEGLSGAPDPDIAEAEFLQRAVEETERSGGGVRADTLARSLGVSPSTLRRRFAVLGLGPKRFAEIVRFRQAHAHLRSTPGATWADVVHRFGYHDQSHFVRDYRRFSGAPPTRWDAGARPIDVRMGIERGGPRESDERP